MIPLLVFTLYFQKIVNIRYEKLHFETQGGKSLDIMLKKLKHQMVENMSSQTADALGLSRAILCNDSLVKKLEELERTEYMYTGLIDHTRKMLRAYFDVFLVFKGRCIYFYILPYIRLHSLTFFF